MRANRSRKQASVNIGAEGTWGVEISSTAIEHEVEASVLSLLAGLEATFSARDILHKKIRSVVSKYGI